MTEKEFYKSIEKLNEYQRQAVLDESAACLVNANVGSGKTTVLTTKIRYLHEVKQVPYEEMVVLTFTNKAANEIKERMQGQNAYGNADENIGTFHSVALNLLKNILPVERLGFTKDFFVCEPEEETEMALQLIRRHKLNIKYKNRLKKRLETEKKPRFQDDLPTLRLLLEKEKITQNKLTFSDLIKYCVQLLKAQDQFHPRWIIIDEVQDSDGTQLELIDALMGTDSHLFAVGDPNQVIYSWRGSAFQVFYQLRTKYHAKELSLPVNYRSSNLILEAARFFQQNGSALIGSRESGEPIVVREAYDSFQEADYLADKIIELQKSGLPLPEIAVFYRLQSQSEVLEKVFGRQGIPYEVSQKRTIQDIPVLQWMLRVLRFSMNPSDTTSGVYVLSHKVYGVRMKEDKADSQIKEATAHIKEVIVRSEETDIQKEEFYEINDEINNKINSKIIENQWKQNRENKSYKLDDINSLLWRMLRFREEMRNCNPDAESLYEYFALDNQLHPTSADYQEDKKAVIQLFSILLQFHAKRKQTFLEAVSEFLNSQALYGINFLDEEKREDRNSVKLMTLHAAKGLGFSCVFIIGVNDGLLPLFGKGMEAEEEERRLFFVGMTRAKDHLELSYLKNPDHLRIMPGKGKFLRMLPASLLIEDGKINPDEKLVDLKALSRMVKMEQKDKRKPKENVDEQEEKIRFPENSGISKEKLPSKEDEKKVVHKKYGTGIVVKEDSTMITVVFEGYGEREFIKAFTELEYPE